jgi:hypothetical protein
MDDSIGVWIVIVSAARADSEYPVCDSLWVDGGTVGSLLAQAVELANFDLARCITRLHRRIL